VRLRSFHAETKPAKSKPSFLKKRSKKLLKISGSIAIGERMIFSRPHLTNSQKFFASFFKKEDFLLSLVFPNKQKPCV
jgi:hypothetical protein